MRDGQFPGVETSKFNRLFLFYFKQLKQLEGILFSNSLQLRIKIYR